jgi:hypothetical protein
MSVTLGQYITTPDEFASVEQEEAWCAGVSAHLSRILARGTYPASLRKTLPRFTCRGPLSQPRNDLWVHRFACWWEALPPQIARSLYREVIVQP